MKKLKYITALLFAGALTLASCGSKPQPKVKSVTVSGAPATMLVDETVTLTANVEVENDASKDVTWSSTGDFVTLTDNGDGIVLVTGKSAGTVTITATSKFDTTVSNSVSIQILDKPEVLSVSISGAPEKLGAQQFATLSATVEAKGGASEEVSWSASSAIVEIYDGNDGTALVKALTGGTVTVTATSKFSTEVSDSVTIQILDWAETELAMMMDYFGETVPYFEGEFVWTDTYYSLYSCLTAESTVEADLQSAILGFTNAGWTISGEDNFYDISHIVDVDEQLIFTGSIYFTSTSGVVSVDIYLYRYDSTEWPETQINEFLAFESDKPETVPVIEADAYLLEEDTSYNGLIIYGLGANFDLVEYIYLLQAEGWSIDTQYYSSYRVVLAYSPRGSIELDIYPDYGYMGIYKLGEPLPLYEEWPADEIATLLAKYTNTVPAASGESFILQPGQGGFYDLQIIVNGGSVDEYLTILENEQFTIFYDENYECYTANKDELLLDIYLNGDTMFAICVYSQGIWPADELNAAVESLLGTALEIPSFEAETYTVSDYSSWGFVGLTSTNSVEVSTYLETLTAAEWTVAPGEYEGAYTATSPEENCQLTIEFETYYNGISLSIAAYTPALTEWPTDAIATQVTAMGVTGSPVPALESEYVEGYTVLDPALGYGPVIKVGVSITQTVTVLSNYITSLENSGYFVAGSNYGDPVYALEGETLGISPYRYDASTIYIELIALQEPAHKEEETSEWPSDDIAQYINENSLTGAVPEYAGEYSAAKLDSEHYFATTVVVSVEEGSESTACSLYLSQLTSAGYFVAETLETPDENYDYYAREGDTLALCVYNIPGSGNMLIEFRTLAKPAHQGEEEGEVYDSFPTEALKEIIGEYYASQIPAAEGTSFKLENSSSENGYDVYIYVTGGDHDQYISTLINTGLVHDEYNGEYYFYADDYSYGIDVYPPNDQGVYTINFYCYF